MGLPQTQDPSSRQPDTNETAASTNTSTTTPGSTSAPKPPVSSLPPEALQLATTLFNLARTGATAPLAQYLTAGIPPNLTNDKGDTLLMLAAYHGHLSTVEMLLARGADPDVVNARGQSVLAGAVFKGEEAVVRALVEAGAGLDVGWPSAREAARMFRRVGCLRVFGMEGEAGEVEGGLPERAEGGGE